MIIQENIAGLIIRRRRKGSAGRKDGPEAYEDVASATVELHRFASAKDGDAAYVQLPLKLEGKTFASKDKKNPPVPSVLNVLISMLPIAVGSKYMLDPDPCRLISTHCD